MGGLQLDHTATVTPCRLSEAYRGSGRCIRLASSSNNRPAACKDNKAVAAASHQQPAWDDGSLQASSSNAAHSSRGAGAPVLLQATSLLQWSAASLTDRAAGGGSSSNSRKHVRNSSSSSTANSAAHTGSWDSVQHVPVLLNDEHDASVVQLASSVVRQPSSLDSSSSSSSANQHQLSDAGRQLMVVITQKTRCWQDLAQLVQSQSHCFNAQHCAAALHQLASAWQEQQQAALQQQELRAELRLQRPAVLQLAAVLLRGLRQQISEARGRDVADAVCAAAKLGVQLHVSHTAETAAAAAATDLAAAVGPTSSHASSVAYSSSSSSSSRQQPTPAASGQLSGVADALLDRSAALMSSRRLKSLPLSRLLWGVTQLGLQPSSDWWAAALEATAMQLQETQQQQQQQQQSQQLEHSNCGEAQQQQQQQQQQQLEHRYNGQSCSLVGWAAAKLQAPAPEAWWACYGSAALALLPQMQPQHLARCIWALATARQAPKAGWMPAFYAASGACMREFDAQGLAVMVWSLAVLQQQPPQRWLQQYEAASSACMGTHSMQQLAMTLWALGSINKASPRAATAQPNSSSSSGSVSQQQQQQQPSAAWLEQACSQLSVVEAHVTAQALACVLWGLVQLRAAVPAARLQQLEVLAAPVLRDAQPHGLAVIVWALGRLRGSATRRSVVQRVRRHCQQHPQLLSSSLSGQGLFMLLHGMARFNAWQPENFKQQLLAAATTRVQAGLQPLPAATATNSSSSGSSDKAFTPQQLPVVLLSLTQLRISLPTPLLQQCESLLHPQLQKLPVQQLTVCLFAMGRARHVPSTAFLDAAMARAAAALQQSGPQDVAQLLYGLAAMGGVSEQLIVQVQQRERVARLLARLQQVVPLMDHSCLAMSLWAIARLSLRPSEPLLQAFLQATTTQLPTMSLISIASILSGFRALQYLPPLAWMVETGNAAKVIYNSDVTCKAWQRRNNLRRLEETVTWFNTAVQQQAEASSAADGRSEQQQVAGSRAAGDAARRGAGVLRVNAAGSEAMIAAAVGVAAAVAQQWHP